MPVALNHTIVRAFDKTATARHYTTILKTGGHYRLEHTVRAALDKKYGEHHSTLVLTSEAAA